MIFASASKAEGRGFEPRFSLHKKLAMYALDAYMAFYFYTTPRCQQKRNIP
jgi:hypothetical protein